MKNITDKNILLRGSDNNECQRNIAKSRCSQITFGYQTKEEWKEWLLKEVKKDE